MPPGGGQRPFSATDAIGYGWKKFTENVGPILIAIVVFSLAGAVIFLVAEFILVATGAVSTSVSSGGTSALGVLASLLMALVFITWGALLQAAMARGGLAITAGRQLALGELFNPDRLVVIIIAYVLISLPSIAGNVLQGAGGLVGGGFGFVLILLGLLLALVQIVVSILAFFTVYFIVDQNRGAVDAIKDSMAMVRANVGNTLLLILLSVAVMIAGVVACCVGVLVALPIVIIAQAYAYKTLRGAPVAP